MFSFLFFFFFNFQKINTQICHERCASCTQMATNTSHNCDTCKEGTYFLEGEKNCYYDYEKPDYYIDTTTHNLRKCQNNCYQCNESKCLNCLRGYQLNENYECRECLNNEYIYISDGIEFCQGSKKDFTTCQLKFSKCSGISINSENFECPREYPLLKSNSNQCVLEYLSENYEISNKIIKTQWLNNIISIGTLGCWYIQFAYSSQGDLLLLTYQYDGQQIRSERYLYGISKNGKPLFYNQGNYSYDKLIYSESNTYKFESEFIRIKLYNNNEKDYYLSCSYSDFSIEIIDLENNSIKGISQRTFF